MPHLKDTLNFNFEQPKALHLVVKDTLTDCFDVNVIYDSEVKVFIAECEKLCLVTEAETLAELQQRIIDVVPELIELNHVPIKSNSVTLNFIKGLSI